MRLRHLIPLAFTVGALGCLDRDGLNPPSPGDGGKLDGPAAGGSGGTSATGGSGGTSMGGRGGSGGAGGSQGGTGMGGTSMGGSGGGQGGTGTGGTGMGGTGVDAGRDTRPDLLMCGPVCTIFCPYGNVLDDRGCPTCRCNPPPMCPPVCDIACPYGHQRDANGCELCKCNPPPMCVPVTCKLLCKYGFKKDANGCEICECNPPTCEPKECPQPAPGAPNIMCSDGSVGGPVCERTSEGRCAWIFRECPDADCSQARDTLTCAKLPTCRWLEPGCQEPKLAVAGCYPRAWVNCAASGCPVGKTCVKRVVHPCPGGLAPGAAPSDPASPGLIAPPPPPGCPSCAQEISICQ